MMWQHFALVGIVLLFTVGFYGTIYWFSRPTPEQRARRAEDLERTRRYRERCIREGRPIPPEFMTRKEARAAGLLGRGSADIPEGRD